jgi:glycerol kinase
VSYIVSIDQSTAGTKGIVWDDRGRLLARADIPHRQITDVRGWISHDPMEIYSNSVEAVKQALEKANLQPGDIGALGISNQRETAVCWDRKTGEPLCDAVVWQCGRASDIVQKILQTGFGEKAQAVTGLPLSPYFSGAKFGWMMENMPQVKTARDRGRLCCGTIDSWLLFRMTGGLSFRTDYSNASRTQLLDLDILKWSEPMVEAFGLSMDSLPEICFSDSRFGETSLEGLFKTPVPIHGVMGDSHAALFGNRCDKPYRAKATYGTGSSIMMNAGTSRPVSGKGIVTSLAWGMNGSVEYVLEGNINYTGAVIKWLVDDMELLDSPQNAGKTAATVDSAGGVYLIPAFTGLGAPYFNDAVRAAVVGINRGTKKAHLIRAAEECIAYQIRDVVEGINAMIPVPLSTLRVDGGPARDRFLMQFQADILDLDLEINSTGELSGAGAAYCAAIGAGISDRNGLFSQNNITKIHPDMDRKKREKLYQGWLRAVAGTAGLLSPEKETAE